MVILLPQNAEIINTVFFVVGKKSINKKTRNWKENGTKKIQTNNSRNQVENW